MLSLPERPTRRLVQSIHQRPYLYLLVALLLTGAMVEAAKGLKLKSRLEDLLPQSAPSVLAMKALKERLGSADSLVITLMTDDFNRVKPALPGIAAALEAHPDIRNVEWELDLEIIEKNALLIFPTLEQLQEYYEDLTETIKEAVKKKLNLFPEEDDKEASVEHHYAWGELEQTDALSRLGRKFRKEKGQYKPFFFNRAYTTIGLQAFPARPSGDLGFSRRIVKEARQIILDEVNKRLGSVGPDQIIKRVDLGGSYRSAIDESNAIKSDLVRSSGWSLGLLALVIIGFFRSIRAFFCVMVPLVVGTAWTAGLVALTVGYLNLITAFIFAVLLGLGIDFGIHFYGRYREERAAGHDPLEAMVHTHLHCGEASLLAATTTAAAFLALTLADFRGFSQFGGVAAAGVLLCLFAVFIVFPAMVFITERWVSLRLMGYRVDRGADGQVARRKFPVGGPFVLIGMALCVTALAVAPNMLEFELDFRKLGQKNKAAKEYERIQYGTTQATAPAVIMADTSEEARAYYDQLVERTSGEERHPRIKSFQSMFSLIPTQQPEKIKVIKRMCRKLKRKIGLFEGDPRAGGDEMLSHCDPAEMGVGDLPDWVRTQFTDKRGRLGEFIYVSPRGSVNDGKVALAFREEMLSLKGADGGPPMVSGKPMVWAEVIIAMKEDGQLMTLASLAVVVLLLFLFEQRLTGVLIILTPLVSAFGITLGVMALLDIKLNFFNMLAVPTIIGMGVDDGVHMYHRYKELGRLSARYIVKTTGMSAFLTTLTTSVGFGSLMTANHRGLNSLGFLTLVGMAAALFATVTLLPAALQMIDNRAEKRATPAA